LAILGKVYTFGNFQSAKLLRTYVLRDFKYVTLWLFMPTIFIFCIVCTWK